MKKFNQFINESTPKFFGTTQTIYKKYMTKIEKELLEVIDFIIDDVDHLQNKSLPDQLSDILKVIQREKKQGLVLSDD